MHVLFLLHKPRTLTPVSVTVFMSDYIIRIEIGSQGTYHGPTVFGYDPKISADTLCFPFRSIIYTTMPNVKPIMGSVFGRVMPDIDV